MATFKKGTLATTGENYDSANSDGVSKIIGDAIVGEHGSGNFKPGANDDNGKKGIQALAQALVESVDIGGGSPIGTVMWWHKDLSGVPALPENWAECNGQTVSDPDSPLNGVALPDINGDNRFIRGSSTSGTLQDDQNKSHDHSTSITVSTNAGTGNSAVQGDGSPDDFFSEESTLDGGVEARPINISMVAIIRIK